MVNLPNRLRRRRGTRWTTWLQESTTRDNSLRLTWQANERNKITFSHADQGHCLCQFWAACGTVDHNASLDYDYSDIRVRPAADSICSNVSPSTPGAHRWPSPMHTHAVWVYWLQRRCERERNQPVRASPFAGADRRLITGGVGSCGRIRANEGAAMTEALRLIGLTQDGALLPVILACAVVWMTMTVRQLRGDVTGLRKDHERMDGKLERLAGDVAGLRTDVAYLRGRAEREDN